MVQQSDEEATMRSYLLGDLDEEHREPVEEQLLCDNDFAERLYDAQDHLIDDYVFGGLSEGERESFQKNFVLSKERRNKLLIAQALEVYVTDGPERHRVAGDSSALLSKRWRNMILFLQRRKGWVAISLATALLLIFLVPKIATWLMPKNAVSPLDAQRAGIERQIAELNRRPLVATNEATFEVALQPTLLREGGETRKVVIDKNIKLVLLKLELPLRKYERYRAIVRTVDGDELFAVPDLKPEVGTGAGTILLRIPSEFLPTNDYQIDLRGMTNDDGAGEAAQFDFRVIHTAAR